MSFIPGKVVKQINKCCEGQASARFEVKYDGDPDTYTLRNLYKDYEEGSLQIL